MSANFESVAPFCKERFAQLGGNLLLSGFDRGAILEYATCAKKDAAELVRKKLDWV